MNFGLKMPSHATVNWLKKESHRQLQKEWKYDFSSSIFFFVFVDFVSVMMKWRESQRTKTKTECPRWSFSVSTDSHVFGCETKSQLLSSTVNGWRILFTVSPNNFEYEKSVKLFGNTICASIWQREKSTFRFGDFLPFIRFHASHHSSVRNWGQMACNEQIHSRCLFREIRRSFFCFLFSVFGYELVERLFWLHHSYSLCVCYEIRYMANAKAPRGNRHTQLPINFLTFLLAKFSLFSRTLTMFGRSECQWTEWNFILRAMATIKWFKNQQKKKNK